jgi:UDP-2-acetamido-3-amino-2,3-dideoxy-glucuronate N-acetyltransferase
MSISPVQVAVIGCGHWGKNLIRNFQRLQALRVVCDLDKASLGALGHQYPGLHTSSDMHGVLSDPTIDGVVIATPSVTHYAIAKAALEAGKHVYVEKPMATSTAQVQELLRLSDSLNRVLMVGHLLLYHPAVNRLRQLIEDGALGRIRYMQSDRLNYNPHRRDQSVMWDLAPHDLSLMAYLLQAEPEALVSVNAHRTSPDGLVDVVHLELVYPDGVGGHVHNSWVHPVKQVKLVVRGTRGMALIDDTLGIGKLQVFTKETTLMRDTPEYLAIEPLKLECQHFLRCMQTGQTPKTDGANGYQVVRILEMADRMMQTPTCL